EGTLDDAQWLASGANKAHGQRRTNEGKRRAVEMALRLHPERSDTWIASHVGVDRGTVTTHRERLEDAGEIPEIVRRQSEDGTWKDLLPRRVREFHAPGNVSNSRVAASHPNAGALERAKQHLGGPAPTPQFKMPETCGKCGEVFEAMRGHICGEG